MPEEKTLLGEFAVVNLLQTSPSAKQRGEKLLGFNLLHLQKYLIKEGK